MTSPISSHFSFIVRCWRDANGILRGWVVDALTQRSYPFATEREMTARIDTLVNDTQQNTIPSISHPLEEDKRRTS
ncbi:MAG: hypothetical protein ACOYZ6_07415 [Chloroflexota bacterium]